MSSLFDAAVFLAQGTADGGDPRKAMLFQFLTIGLMVGGFYFLFIAPQRKKQKEHDAMLGGLQSGDEIITTGGIYGTIASVKTDRFIVRIAEGTKVELGKSFIQAVVKSQASPAKEDKK